MYSIANINTISDRLPYEIREQMSPSHFLIIDLLVSIMKSTSRRSPSKAFYAFPSEEWIASRLGYTRTYMSECITQLSSLGLLWVTHRRQVAGRWQTNLYRVGEALARALKIVSAYVSSVIHHVGNIRHLVNKPHNSNLSKDAKTTFNNKKPESAAEIMAYIHDLGRRLPLTKDISAS